jgi:MurNAc alpha-1-phosphate uridylyltransferase
MRRGMILAAGRGKRMGELTTHVPKPLLRVRGRYLIEYAISSFKQAGITEIVVNIAYLAQQIKTALGDGALYGVKLIYSEETEALETGGGILQALPWLGKEPFFVMSSDIITDYPLDRLPRRLEGMAHLLLVKNPSFHAEGDYELQKDRVVLAKPSSFTYASVGVFSPALFSGCAPGYFRLTEVLNPAIAAGQVTGECYNGVWHNVGTPADIEATNAFIC